MSISGDLNAKALGAQKACNHFGTDDESAHFDRTRRQPSRAEDAISDNRSRLVGNLDGKRRSKPIKHWLDYQTSQLEERRSKLHSRIIKKLSAVYELLYLSRNAEKIREQMTQIDDKYKMLMEVHKEYYSFLPL